MDYLHPDAPAEKPAVVALYSGGVDSYCMSYLVQPDVLLQVNMGGKYGDAEAARLRPPASFTGTVIPLDCKVIGEFEDPVTSIVPGRNAFLALLGAQFGSTLLLASVYEEAHVGGADKDEGWCQAMAGLFDHMFQPQRWLPQGRTVRIKLPVHHLTKAQVVGLTLAAGHEPTSLASNTFSCYSPVRHRMPRHGNPGPWRECGQCGACARKWAAFAVWGVPVGFDRPMAHDGYLAEAHSLLRHPSERQDMRTAQWVADQLDAANGVVREIGEVANYPAPEPVR